MAHYLQSLGGLHTPSIESFARITIIRHAVSFFVAIELKQEGSHDTSYIVALHQEEMHR